MDVRERREHLVGLLLPLFLGRMVSYERGGDYEEASIREATDLAERVMAYMDKREDDAKGS